MSFRKRGVSKVQRENFAILFRKRGVSKVQVKFSKKIRYNGKNGLYHRTAPCTMFEGFSGMGRVRFQNGLIKEGRNKVQPIFERCTLFFRKFPIVPPRHPFPKIFGPCTLKTPLFRNSIFWKNRIMMATEKHFNFLGRREVPGQKFSNHIIKVLSLKFN